MECVNKCGMELTGRQREFCSDKCLMQHKRANKTSQDCSGLANSNKPEQIHPLKVEQAQTRTKSNKGITIISERAANDTRLANRAEYAEPIKPQSYNPMMVGYVPLKA